jgi:hypothetical protein
MRPVLPIDILPDPLRRRYEREAGPLPPAPRLPNNPVVPPGLAAVEARLEYLARLARQVDTPFDERAPLDRFLGTAAVTASGSHLLAVEHLLSEGVCGLQAAAAARAMLDDALLWAWVAEQRNLREHVLGAAAVEEWDRLVAAAATGCGIGPMCVDRWRPASLAELDRFRNPGSVPSASTLVAGVSDGSISGAAANMLRFDGLEIAVAVLAECSHFNRFAALYAPIPFLPSEDPEEGPFDVGGRLVGEVHALVAQVAAQSFAVVCLATAGLFPGPLLGPTSSELPLDAIVDAAIDVCDSAARVHGLGVPTRPSPIRVIRGAPPGREGTVRVAVDVPEPADVVAIDAIRSAGYQMFDTVYEAAPAISVVHPVSRLRCVVLPLYASTMWAFRTVAHTTNVTTIAAFAARQLVEEAARWDWALAVQLSEDENARRGDGLKLDMKRSRRRILRAADSAGRSNQSVRAFVEPNGFDVLDLISGSAGGEPVPVSPTDALLAIRTRGGETSSWLVTAYSVLSQITHQTPLGVIHAIRSDGTDAAAGPLSGPMEALAIDTACTAAARLLWCLGPILMGGLRGRDGAIFDPAAYYAWREESTVLAAEVHQLAAPVHGVFSPSHAPFQRLGRNDPCLCGSSRKAKKCHGAPASSTSQQADL